MQKANTNAYDQRTDDVSQFVNVDKAQQIGALDGFTFSLAERIAKQSKERNFARDVMSVAFRGTEPYQLMNDLGNEAAMADQNAAKLENRRLKLQSDLAAMSPEQADDTNYRAALGAYEQMIRNIPQAPQLERFGFSDTDKMMIGFALLMGANPADAIGKFVQTKMGFMDIQNRQTQEQFQIDQSLYRDQLRGLGDIVDIENQRLNRDQFSLDRQFGLQSQNINRELNAVNQAIDDDRLRLQNLNQVTNQRRQTLLALFDKEGVSGPNYANTYRQFVLQEAKDRGIAPEEAERLLISIAPGTKTQQTLNQEATQELNRQKFNLAKDQYETRTDYQNRSLALRKTSAAAKALNDTVRQIGRTGIITDDDVAAFEAKRNELLQDPAVDGRFLPLAPKPGESWQVVMGRFNAEMQTAKFDYAKEADKLDVYDKTVLKPLEDKLKRAESEFEAQRERYNKGVQALAELQAAHNAAPSKETKAALQAAQSGFIAVDSAFKKREKDVQDARAAYEAAISRGPVIPESKSPNLGGGQPKPMGGKLNTGSGFRPGQPLPDQDGNYTPADPSNVTRDFPKNTSPKQAKTGKQSAKKATANQPKTTAKKTTQRPANDTKYGDFK